MYIRECLGSSVRLKGGEWPKRRAMLTFLVIDDDPNIADMITVSARRRWPTARVISALTGEAGLQLAHTEDLSAIVLDYDLPDMDGITLCKRIRSFSQVPIVMLSGRMETADRTRALAAGAQAVMSKPVVLAALLDQLAAVARL
jgi:two-component system KDP operon response regulator KdpE